MPAAAVIPDPGPYVAAGTVKASDCSCYTCTMPATSVVFMTCPPSVQSRIALYCASCLLGLTFSIKRMFKHCQRSSFPNSINVLIRFV